MCFKRSLIFISYHLKFEFGCLDKTYFQVATMRKHKKLGELRTLCWVQLMWNFAKSCCQFLSTHITLSHHWGCKTLYLNKEALHTPGFSRLVSPCYICISLTHHTMGSGLSHKLKVEPAWKAWGCEICLPLVTLGYLSLPLLTSACLGFPLLTLYLPVCCYALLGLLGLTGPYWSWLVLTGPCWAILGLPWWSKYLFWICTLTN